MYELNRRNARDKKNIFVYGRKNAFKLFELIEEVGVRVARRQNVATVRCVEFCRHLSCL